MVLKFARVTLCEFYFQERKNKTKTTTIFSCKSRYNFEKKTLHGRWACGGKSLMSLFAFPCQKSPQTPPDIVKIFITTKCFRKKQK